MVAWDIAMLPNRLDRVQSIKFEAGACCANNVVLCDGAHLGPNCLVGDCAYGPSDFKFMGGAWNIKPQPRLRPPPWKTQSLHLKLPRGRMRPSNSHTGFPGKSACLSLNF